MNDVEIQEKNNNSPENTIIQVNNQTLD